MTVRYAILLIPHPACTARAYRARQIICGQYGSWAAEMLMVHLMLSEFFSCPDTSVDALAAGLTAVASQSRSEAPGFELSHQGVATHPGMAGTLFLDFTPQDPADPLGVLHARIDGLVSDFAAPGESRGPADGRFRIFLPLMQYAGLSTDLFSDALEFANAVVEDLEVPHTTTAWRLILARFQSQAAGEDWSQGKWATDVSWQFVASCPL